MEPFEIAISDDVLEDLRRRLEHTRWPDEMPGTGWEYGSNLDYIKELVEYWRTDFDWRAQEKKLNAFNHFKTDVDGLSIHFIKENGTGPNPMPLVITHGWPSTFFEMTKIIPLLADPGGATAGIRQTPSTWSRRHCPASVSRRRRRNRGCRCRRLRTCGPS